MDTHKKLIVVWKSQGILPLLETGHYYENQPLEIRSEVHLLLIDEHNLGIPYLEIICKEQIVKLMTKELARLNQIDQTTREWWK